MKVVISGPTGAIGMALLNYCINQKEEVLLLCHKGSERQKQIPSHPLIKVVYADLEEYQNLDNLTENEWDIFYHFAWKGTIGSARNEVNIQLNNIKYTLEAVSLAKRLGCKTFIGAGSQAEYGRIEEKLSGDTPVFPENAYGMAKLAAGQMSRLLCEQLEMRHIWIRVLSIYGPYDGKQSMVMSTIKQLLEKETPIFTKGEQQWDYLYSKDAARALYLLGKFGKDKKVYCLGSGKTKSLKEYIFQIRNAINPELNVRMGEIPYSEKQVMYLCADIKELQNDVGFAPEISFEKGIKETIEYVINEKRKEDEEN